MAAEQLARAVREQLGLGRLLPLGSAGDGVWLAERAAAGVLRAAVDGLPGVRLDRLRIGRAEADTAGAQGSDGQPVEPGHSGPEGEESVRPPSALPPGPLYIEADFAAAGDAPLPERADRLRALLAATAEPRRGFEPAEIDLLVTGLLDEDPPEDAGPDAGNSGDTQDGPAGARAPAAHQGAAAEVAAAVLAVPGVSRLAAVLGGRARAVRLDGDRVQVQLAVDGAHRVLEVAREARRAAAGAADTDRVAVLVTAID
jgi:hypothetical protein